MQGNSSPPPGEHYEKGRALVIGNGESRAWFVPKQYRLDADVHVWGCNAIYRDGYVDGLVAIDYAMQQEIYDSGYCLDNPEFGDIKNIHFANWSVVPAEVADMMFMGYGIPEEFIHRSKNRTDQCVISGKDPVTLGEKIETAIKMNPGLDMNDLRLKMEKDAGVWITYVEPNDDVVPIDYPVGWSAGNTALYLASKNAEEIYVEGKRNDEWYRVEQNEDVYYQFWDMDSLISEYADLHYPNGQLIEKISYKEGLKDGKFTGYYPSGKVEYVKRYEEDKPMGVWKFVKEDGTTKKIERYEMGKKNEEWITYEENGDVYYQYWDQDSLVSEYADLHYPNGQLIEKISYKEGRKNGKFTGYYESGQTKYIRTYKDDKLEGKYADYTESGQILLKQSYANDLLDLAIESKADFVKFQTFKADKLVTKEASKAIYQKESSDTDELQHSMLKKLELPFEAHYEISDYCTNKGIQFLSTAFDLESLAFLSNDLKLEILKIPSGEVTNGPLLLEYAKTGRELILSTGMATLDEIRQALAVLAFGLIGGKTPSINAFLKAYESEEGQIALRDRVILLHCTTQYPAPFETINLRAMATLRDTFHLKVGYSDHSRGILVPCAATALGAVSIEKHFTLDCGASGPDHSASLEPVELEQMVEAIRAVHVMLGDGDKTPRGDEMKNREIARKSLVAAQEISEGERFSQENMTAKRPGTGRSPMSYWNYLGNVTTKSYCTDELID